MQFSHQDVPLTRIDPGDATFRISTKDATRQLIRSVAEVGLINPPTLIPKSNHYGIVSGFARIQACRANGWATLPARIISPETPRQWCVLHAIIDNSFQRPLNFVEQSRAVDLFKGICSDHTEVVAMAQQAGLAWNPDMVAKLETVGCMPETLKEGLIEGTIALPVALKLHDQFEAPVVSALSRFLSALQLSLNRQRTLLDWLEAIAHRDHIGMEQLLAESPIQEALMDTQMDAPQKATLIWQYLQMRRSPAGASLNRKYKALVKQLRLRKGVRLTAPANFEGQTYLLQLAFNNLEQLESMEKELHRIVRSPHMADILNLIYQPIP